MKLGVKSIRRLEMARILDKDFDMIEVDEVYFTGIVGLLTIKDITSPLLITYPYGNICIADKNYKWLQFAPKKLNWWLTVMFNENNEIIESYFDITKENFIENDNPYFIDMKLDVVIPNKALPLIIDSDELKEAFDIGLINEAEYSLAIKIADEIVYNYNSNKELYYEIVDMYFKRLWK